MPGNRETALKNLAKAGKSPGRPKGSKDKFTKLRDEFIRAFYDPSIGGHKLLIEMLKNPKERAVIIQIIGRMLPRYTDVHHSGEGIVINIQTPGIKKAIDVTPVSGRISNEQAGQVAGDIIGAVGGVKKVKSPAIEIPERGDKEK